MNHPKMRMTLKNKTQMMTELHFGFFHPKSAYRHGI
jgi:hypothetical protein